jgi:hypothetical protein
MRRLGSLIRTWPFLSLGFFTFGLFLALEGFGEPPRPLVAVLRVLVVPLWLMRTLEMLVGIGGWPAPLQFLVALPLLFLPYLAADLLLRLARRQWVSHHAAAR